MSFNSWNSVTLVCTFVAHFLQFLEKFLSYAYKLPSGSERLGPIAKKAGVEVGAGVITRVNIEN